MIIGCIQPSYLPWKGYFHIIQKSDIFVFHDDIQYDKQSWRNRNLIKTSKGKQWITVPVKLKDNWRKNICDVDEATLSKTIRIVKASGLTVTNIDCLTLRCDLENDEEYSQHIKHLLRSIEIAPLFDTNVVRLFSFWKVENVEGKWDQIFEKMELPIKIAEREGVILGFENVSSGNIGTSDDLARLFQRFDSPNLKLIWDPGNAYAAGEETPFPDGYEKIKGKIIHVHVKDVVFSEQGERI